MRPVDAAVPIRPAATVIVLRDAPDGPEVLLVQRAGELAFHGGAWVFPGGRVEPEDLHHGDPLGAARSAGVRETREEAGLSLDPHALVPFSHWTTPEGRPRRFSTWFFLAQVSATCDVVVDGGEIDLPPPTYVSLSVLARRADVAEALTLARAAKAPVFVPRPRDVSGGVVSLFPGDAAYEGAPLDAPGPRHRLWMLESGYRYEASSE